MYFDQPSALYVCDGTSYTLFVPASAPSTADGIVGPGGKKVCGLSAVGAMYYDSNLSTIFVCDGSEYRMITGNKVTAATVVAGNFASYASVACQLTSATTSTNLVGLNAAITQGIGITALARRSVPDNLKIVTGQHLPNLGKINICLFDCTKQRMHKHHGGNQSTISHTLIQFIANRLPRV